MISLRPDLSPPRVDIVMAVLESARDAEATKYVAMCVRPVAANRRGWRGHADKGDWKAVLEAYKGVYLAGRSNRLAE